MKILWTSSKSDTVVNSVLPVKFSPIMPPSKLLLWMAVNVANVNVPNIVNCAKCSLKNDYCYIDMHLLIWILHL